MGIIKDIFKIFNGTSWDEHYFKTSSDQVVHTTADGVATTAQQELLDINSALNKVNSTLSEMNTSLGDLQFNHQNFSSVTETYVPGNALVLNRVNINPTNYPSSAFLVILTSAQSLGKATVYIVFTGTKGDSSGISFMRVDNNEGTVPTLVKTESGGAGVIWSGSATALIRASIFKL